MLVSNASWQYAKSANNYPQSPVPSPYSLYIHIPFCADRKCDYCDFYSTPVEGTEAGDPRLLHYVESILAEGERLFETYKPDAVPTVYIGGGTPSVLGPRLIRRLLSGLLKLITRTAPLPLEITVEANPESADEAFLDAARKGGATRLSLGVQSFHGPSRRAVRRIGDEALLPGRLALAAGYFPGAFSADLITGLPFQDEGVILNDIAALLSYKPAHVSLYALTVEPGTPLAGSLATAGTVNPRGKSLLPSRDEADRLWLAGRNALEKAGYHQYEVSNFCLSGKESLHNIRYWRIQNWLALGPSASGTIIDDQTGTGFRYTLPSTILRRPLTSNLRFALTGNTEEGSEFANFSVNSVNSVNSVCPVRGLLLKLAHMVPGTVFEELDSLTLIKESLLMGFRYIEGPDEALFLRRFKKPVDELIPKTMGAWQERGLLRKDKAAMTKEGLLFLDQFLIEAFGEVGWG